jgi:hypothetical protein
MERRAQVASFNTSAKPIDFVRRLEKGMSTEDGRVCCRSWIQTIPGKGWFAYFRGYGPEESAFDGSRKPGDFEEMK